MSTRAAPAASLLVAVQVRQNVALLADSPSLDELPDQLSPEGCSVALELVVSRHTTHASRAAGSLKVDATLGSPTLVAAPRNEMIATSKEVHRAGCAFVHSTR